MSRPQGVHAGESAGNPSSGNRIDAAVGARAGTKIERRFVAADLPRLQEAGARDGSTLTATFAFAEFDGHVVIDGQLDGVFVLTCQRCMGALEFPVHETFKVMLVRDEAELDLEPGGYETMLADPARFDLQALAEDQALLALPLVPKHDSQCVGAVADDDAGSEESEPETQKPFGNLRDLMRGR